MFAFFVSALVALSSGSSLFPTIDEIADERAAALGSELEETLEAIPLVYDARVQLALLAEPNWGNKSNTLPKAAVVVVLLEGAIFERVKLEEQLRALVVAAVPKLTPDHVELQIFEHMSQTQAVQTAKVGPIEVTAATYDMARGIIGALLVMCLLLAGLLVYAGMRLRLTSAKR